uniref:ZP domain-containing protein n=1 Tax=Takifugu rubripes TaxID=31033 RepID=A0A3B5KEN8_TAKRU
MLSVLVEKRAGHVVLTADALQLGDNCYSNQDLPNQHAFIYGVDECGTARVVSGFDAFRLSAQIQHCCSSITASWTGQAESIIYERGQLIHFQISAKTGPEQQLFIQSCFISASEECATLLDSYSAVRFVASKRPDVTNFVLNTSYIIPEPFIHCTVLVSDLGTTPGSKSCNYDVTQWEDLSGAKDVCACCGSRCRGLSLKNAVLTIGPFVVKDVKSPLHPPETSEAFDNDLMQSDSSAALDWVGSEVSGNQFASTPGDVVVVSQNPAAALALWLPGELKEGLEQADDFKEQVESHTLKNDPFGEQDSVQKQESENSNANEFDIFAKLVESPAKIWRAKIDLFGKRSAGEDGLPPEEVPDMDDSEALSERQVGPAIRSKLRFSKGTDGSQTLSYEEEVLRKSDDEGDCAMKKRGRRGLRSVFLDLIR